MLNYLWALMIIIGIIFGIVTGNIEVMQSLTLETVSYVLCWSNVMSGNYTNCKTSG